MKLQKENNFPRITIITACLNAVTTLERTLLSVLEQHYPSLEYIVIDGASVDGTLDIINKYSSRLTHVVSEPDQGIYDAFNKGLALATGDVVGIVNADDFYAPWTLHQVAEAYRLNPRCGVFYGKLAVIDRGRRQWRAYPLGDPARLLDCMSVPHPATFVASRMYRAHGFFDAGLSIVGDWDFMLRLYGADEKFCPVNKVLAAFSNTGISSSPSRKLVAENKRIYARYHTSWGALGKKFRSEVKYWGRKFLTGTGCYGLYRRCRDKTTLCVEASGRYDGVEALWDTLLKEPTCEQ